MQSIQLLTNHTLTLIFLSTKSNFSKTRMHNRKVTSISNNVFLKSRLSDLAHFSWKIQIFQSVNLTVPDLGVYMSCQNVEMDGVFKFIGKNINIPSITYILNYLIYYIMMYSRHLFIPFTQKSETNLLLMKYKCSS